ncbi:MAG: F0F1 ATP synthase subunit B [Bacteroidota bacterium]|nr:F0F1 ATP synthase subunit B [Bacteroidota bacterium]MDP4206430.1 F0F1 ATP synthase subunit B [Bacteroidota bacterium]
MTFYLLDLFVNPNSGTIIWMLFVFLLAFIILRKFAWRPLLNALEERKRSIDDSLSAAQKAREEMVAFKATNEQIMQKAMQEREGLLNEARVLKNKIINEARHQATKEAQKIVEEARHTIEKEKKSAMLEIRGMVADLSVQIAEKILREELEDNRSQKRLAEKIFDDLKMN